MKREIVITNDGREFELTENEAKYLRAIKRIEKMEPGRLALFGSGRLSVRIGGIWNKDEILMTSIFCEGGDGGDNA